MGSTLAAAQTSVGALSFVVFEIRGMRRMLVLFLALVSCAARRTEAQKLVPSSGSPQGGDLELFLGVVEASYCRFAHSATCQCRVGGFRSGQVLSLSRRGMHRGCWTHWFARRPSADPCRCRGLQAQYVQLSNPRYAK